MALPLACGGFALAQRPASAFTRARATTANATTDPASALIAARVQHLAMEQRQAASSLTSWSAVGPSSVNTAAFGLISGRVTSIAIDPSDITGNTVYVGTTGGGVWISTNAAGPASAVLFTPLTDSLPVFSANAGSGVIASLSIGAITVQPGGTGVVLAGTGDPNDAADSYYGSGLLRSADHGATWSLVQTSQTAASFIGQGFAGFAWSDVAPQTVVAAVSSAAEAATVNASKFPGVRGLYVSTDAGATWKLATVQDGSTVVQGPSTDYSSFRGNAATAVVWNPLRKQFYAAVRSHGYYESADGLNWTRLTQQPGADLTTLNCPPRSGMDGLAGCAIFRGALAVQPVSGDLFALTVDTTNRSEGLWQDTCAKAGAGCLHNRVVEHKDQ